MDWDEVINICLAFANFLMALERKAHCSLI